MQDRDKTKEQLISDLLGLRQRISELEDSEARHRQAEDKLRDSEQHFHSIVETASEAVISIDSHGNIVYWNPAAEVIFGFSADEVIGQPITITIPDRFHRDFQKGLSALISSDGSDLIGLTTEVVGLKKDKSEFPLEHRLVARDIEDRGFLTVMVRDITERQQTDLALKELEDKYRSLAENPIDGVVIVQESQILYVNNTALRMFGAASEDDMVGHDYTDFVSPVDRELIKERGFARDRGEDVIQHYQFKALRKDGTEFDAELYVTCIHFKGKTARQGIIRDITKSRQAEEIHRTIFKTALDGFCITDVEGRLLEANDYYCHMVGYTREELLKMAVTDIEAMENPEESARHLIRIREQGYDRFETRHKRRDGSIIDVDVSANYLDVGEGQIFVFLRDITERKQAEESLRESEEKLRRIFDSVTDGITLTDLNGNIIDINERSLQLSGFSFKSDLLGRNAFNTIAPYDRERAMVLMQQLVREGAVGSAEFTLLRADSSEYPAEICASVVKDSTGNPVGFVSVIRDITERKQAAEALLDSEKRYRELVDLLPQTVFEIDETGKVVFSNRHGFEVTGYTRQDLEQGVNTLQLFVPEDRDRARENIGRVLRGERLGGNEYTLVTKDGQPFPVIVYSVPISRGEKIVGLRGVVIDITEWKHAEEELRESELKYRELAESISDIFFAFDEELRYTYWNKASETLTGIPAESALGKHIYDIFPRDEQTKRSEELYLEVLKTKKPQHFSNEYNNKGTKHIFGISAYPSRGGISVFVKDITEYIQATEALRESEERYRALVELGGEVGEAIIMIRDTDRGYGIQTFVSDMWPRITGYSEEELLGKSFFELVHPAYHQASLERHQRRMKGEIILGFFEMPIIRKDGTEVHIELTSAYATYQGERVNVAFIRDITERREAEEREKQLQQELALYNRLASVGELAAGVAHELNNPLTGVLGFSQRLLGKTVDSDIRRDLERIHEQAQRATKVVENLLAFARRREPKKEYSDINDIIQKTLELRAYELKTGNIDVVVKLDSRLPGTMVDYQHIEQVFLNILLNTEQAMTEAKNAGKLVIKTRKRKNWIRISFADNGPGIAAENLEKLFDPFFTTRGDKGGTGLGLSVCHGIVLEHGGNIYARSKPGKGTTFIVELPIKTEKEDTSQDVETGND